MDLALLTFMRSLTLNRNLKLKEIKSAFKKDYDRNIQYLKFFKKVNKQVKTEVNDDVKGGSKGRKKK
jgi:hypothetical protein